MTNIINLDEVRAQIPRTKEWWDEWFLGMAAYVSSASKDPSTQCGTIIVRPDKTIASVGYNGFPRGIKDNERLNNRENKYSLMLHSEMNAILNAKEPLNNFILYNYSMPPCDRCAVHIIQSGIKLVISLKLSEDKKERWQNSVDKSLDYFREAGVSYILY